MRWTLWAIGAVLVLAAWLGLPVVATAGDWTGTAHIGETVEANDNPQLQPKSNGGAVGSITNLSLEAVDEWPTVHWEIGTNLGFSEFWGPGAVSSLDGVKGGVVHTALDKTTPLTDYHAAFSGSVLPASVSQVLDSGITNANTTSMSYSGQGSLKHQVDGLNAIGLTVSGTSESFTDNGSPNSASARLTPNSYLTAGQSWIHNVSPRTDLTLGASTGWYTAADGVTGINNNSVSESVTAQIQTQLSERFNFSGGGGGNVVRTTGSSDSTSTGFIANARLAYALDQTTVVAFASHDLAPSALGSLQERTQAGVTVGHQINEFSSLLLSGIFVYQLPVASIQNDPNQNQQHQGLVLSVSYNRNLSQFWDLQLAYNFTQQNNSDVEFFQLLDNNGSSTSNAVFLTVSRNFNLFGPASPEGAPADIGAGNTGLFGPTATSPVRVPEMLAARQ